MRDSQIIICTSRCAFLNKAKDIITGLHGTTYPNADKTTSCLLVLPIQSISFRQTTIIIIDTYLRIADANIMMKELDKMKKRKAQHSKLRREP